jgi:MFS family permease
MGSDNVHTGPMTDRLIRRPLLGLFVVALGASLAAMDLAVNVAFPAVTLQFDLEPALIRWLVICYVLTYASLMLAFGNLGDRVGHRKVFVAGVLVSLAALAGCALAPTYPALLLARVAQGVGTALVLSCAPALATLLFQEAERTKALGAYSALLSAASIAAPLLGGLAIAALGWSGAFWFRVPFALAALLLLPWLTVKASLPVGMPVRFEVRGPLLLASGIALSLLGAALMHSELAPVLAVSPVLAGCVLLAAFARHEHKAAAPLFPQQAVRDADFILRNLAAVAVHFTAFAVPLLLPYHLARVAGFSASEVGVLIAMSPVGMLLGSLLAVPLARHAGVGVAALLGGLTVALGSMALAAAAGFAWLGAIVASLLLHGAALGIFQVAYTDAIVAALPSHARGVAGSLTMVTRTVGVVAAATALTAAVQWLQGGTPGPPRAADAEFAAAIETVFLYCGAVLGILLLASALRRRLWFAS